VVASDKDQPPGEPPSPARALELARAGRHAEADDAFAEYVAAHPNDARALASAGKTAVNAGRIGVALKRFEQLAPLHPASAEARSALGFALIRAGKPIGDVSRDIRDFGDSAAIIDALDVVIGVDTSVVQLAGAMGKPVWLLDRFHTSWRRRASDRDSAWYASLRIFRQERFLDWRQPIAEVAAALAALAGKRSRQA
jgi:ADP-heptose:LPS heptosyltransferase